MRPEIRRSAVQCATARGSRPCNLRSRKSVTRTSPAFSQSPGCTTRSPSFLFFVPRWRNRNTRMSQKHDLPGSNPGWGTRFRREQNASVPLRHSDRMKRMFFYNLGCGQYRAGIAQPEERDVASVEARVRFSLPAPMGSRRLRVRIADLHSADAGSSPAGNTKIFLAVA